MRVESKWSIGFKGGLNWASMYGSQSSYLVEEYGNSPTINNGPDFGLFLQYSPMKFVGVSVDIFFTTKGYDAIFYDDGNRMDYMEAIRNYFEMPVIVKIQAPFPCRYNPYIFFGTGPAINVTAENRYRITTKSYGFDATGNLVNSKKDVANPVTVNLHHNSTIKDSLGNVIDYTFNDFHRWFDFPLVFGLGHVISFSKIDIVINTRASVSSLSFNRLSSSIKRDLDSKGVTYRELEEKYINISMLVGLAYKF
jgi:hypothetical protein